MIVIHIQLCHKTNFNRTTTVHMSSLPYVLLLVTVNQQKQFKLFCHHTVCHLILGQCILSVFSRIWYCEPIVHTILYIPAFHYGTFTCHGTWKIVCSQPLCVCLYSKRKIKINPHCTWTTWYLYSHILPNVSQT